MKTITTSHVFPPIPLRQFDWLAGYDGEEESQQYGWGRTEQEAIDNLKAQYPVDDITI